MQELTKVPASNLRRYYIQLVGRAPNKKHGMSKVQQAKWLPLVKDFVPKTRGAPGYFLRDEEELFVITLEEAYRAAFPYDGDMLERLASKAGQGVYGKDFKVGRNWRYGFEKRWKERLTTLKCGSIDRSRGKKATTEVKRELNFKTRRCENVECPPGCSFLHRGDKLRRRTSDVAFQQLIIQRAWYNANLRAAVL